MTAKQLIDHIEQMTGALEQEVHELVHGPNTSDLLKVRMESIGEVFSIINGNIKNLRELIG